MTLVTLTVILTMTVTLTGHTHDNTDHRTLHLLQSEAIYWDLSAAVYRLTATACWVLGMVVLSTCGVEVMLKEGKQ